MRTKAVRRPGGRREPSRSMRDLILRSASWSLEKLITCGNTGKGAAYADNLPRLVEMPVKGV
jgi:hypothetical protein